MGYSLVGFLSVLEGRSCRNSNFQTSFFICSAHYWLQQNPAPHFPLFRMLHKHHGTGVIAAVRVDVEDLSTMENYKVLQGFFFLTAFVLLKKKLICVAVKQEEEVIVMLELISQISLSKALSA